MATFQIPSDPRSSLFSYSADTWNHPGPHSTQWLEQWVLPRCKPPKILPRLLAKANLTTARATLGGLALPCPQSQPTTLPLSSGLGGLRGLPLGPQALLPPPRPLHLLSPLRSLAPVAHSSFQRRLQSHFLGEFSPDEINSSPLPQSYLSVPPTYTSPSSTHSVVGYVSPCHHPH